MLSNLRPVISYHTYDQDWLFRLVSALTLPSQRRYVAYFAAKLELGLEYSPARMLLSCSDLPPILAFAIKKFIYSFRYIMSSASMCSVIFISGASDSRATF